MALAKLLSARMDEPRAVAGRATLRQIDRLLDGLAPAAARLAAWPPGRLADLGRGWMDKHCLCCQGQAHLARRPLPRWGADGRRSPPH